MKKDDKKKRKEFEAFCNKKLQEIAKTMLLTHFHVNPIKKSTLIHSNLSHTWFPYRESSIEYAEETFTMYKEGKKRDVVSILVHELTHSLVDPLYVKAQQRFTTHQDLVADMESLTDHITNILMENNVIKI